jgi:hypothetical protein
MGNASSGVLCIGAALSLAGDGDVLQHMQLYNTHRNTAIVFSDTGKYSAPPTCCHTWQLAVLCLWAVP